MADKARRKLNWSSLSRFERLTLVSTILIWMGVVLAGVGLYLAFRNQQMDQVAYAQATVVALLPTQTMTPSPTPLVFPAGWSTATPTATPTTTPTAPPVAPIALPTSIHSGTLSASAKIWITPTLPVERPAIESPPTQSLYPPPASRPPDRIVIAKIKLDSPIVPIGWYVVEEGGQQYSVWQVADYVVGWHKTSAYPGHAGNMVLNGHHNIRGEVFRYLVDLDVGDHILIYVGDQAYHYAVTEKHILKERGEPPEVRRQNAQWIAPTEDERLTMVTCWPYTSNTHRLVVVAKPIPPPDTEGLGLNR
jgi:sortase A